MIGQAFCSWMRCAVDSLNFRKLFSFSLHICA